MTCKNCLYYEMCKICNSFDECGDPVRYDMCKRGECEFFKEKSRFVELPCKVGDTFYAPIRGEICEFECIGFVYGYGKISLITPSSRTFPLNKEAFLTREEAEKALAESE